MSNIVVSQEAFAEMTKDEAKRIKKFRQDVLDYLIGIKLDPEGVENSAEITHLGGWRSFLGDNSTNDNTVIPSGEISLE